MNLKIHLAINLFSKWTSTVTLQLETITLPQNYLPQVMALTKSLFLVTYQLHV